LSRYSEASSDSIMQLEETSLKVFPSSFNKALYKVKIEVYGNEFNGLMMIKEVSKDYYKVAFFNEIGLNFFDFELKPSNDPNRLELNVHNIYASLNRKGILKNFEKDFSMLLAPDLNLGNTTVLNGDQGQPAMLKLDSYKGYDCYIIKSPKLNTDKEIINICKALKKKKIKILISEDNKSKLPETIEIEHMNKNLRLSFRLIHNINSDQ
jgi:hypothetical protein